MSAFDEHLTSLMNAADEKNEGHPAMSRLPFCHRSRSYLELKCANLEEDVLRLKTIQSLQTTLFQRIGEDCVAASWNDREAGIVWKLGVSAFKAAKEKGATFPT